MGVESAGSLFDPVSDVVEGMVLQMMGALSNALSGIMIAQLAVKILILINEREIAWYAELFPDG